jgi:hypothetical protein
VNIVRFNWVGRPFEELADAIVYLLDLLLRFLDWRGWSPVLIGKKKGAKYPQNLKLGRTGK